MRATWRAANEPPVPGRKLADKCLNHPAAILQVCSIIQINIKHAAGVKESLHILT
jgi:hypothetical protein